MAPNEMAKFSRLPKLAWIGRSVVTPSMLVLTPTGASPAFSPSSFRTSDNLRRTAIAALSVLKNGLRIGTKSDRPIQLFNPWGTGYYHWLLEIAPKFILFEDEVRASTVLLPRDTPRFITDFLELFHFNDVEIVGNCIYFDRLRVVTDPRAGHEVEFIESFRDRILETLNLVASPKRKIFVSRRLAKQRMIVNDKEVSKHLAGFGFETHCLEKLSFRDQVKLMAETEILVTLHGAAIANSIFMPKSGSIVEFFPKWDGDQGGVVDTCFQDLASATGLEHRFLFCPRANPGSPFNHRKDDIVVELRELSSIFEAYPENDRD